MTKEEIIKQILVSLNKYGLTNPFIQAAILAIVSKESAFVLGNGENMNYTSTARLRYVWPSIFKTDADAQPYVKQPQKLANKVYGGKYGNTGENDGWLYRGRGWNGITFKSAYDRYGKRIGKDLVNNPDLLNQPQIASDALAVYYMDALTNTGGELKKMGVNSPNDFKDIDTAVQAAMRANAGWKSSTNGNIFKEGKAKAMEAAPGFYNLIQSAIDVPAQTVSTQIAGAKKIWSNKKTRPFVILAGLALVAGTGYAINKAIRI